ncbi:MAG TPA: hypothetical protein VIF62_10760 [Labilithrix sp.]
MAPNPYQPPEPNFATADARSRRLFILAGVGALLASAYWAGLTLLTGVGVASGQMSGARLLLPIVLIALYAVRGVRLFKGDARAAQGIVWLHGIGALMAIVQIASGVPIAIVLYGIKLVIHAFGGVTAFLARKSVTG